MSAISNLQDQHHALAALMLRLVNQVHAFTGSGEAYSITLELGRLTKLLRLHLATEDEWFYPAMLASDEPVAAMLAARYRAEVGGIAERLELFLIQWNSSTVIGLGFEAFQVELFDLFRKIEQRIGREDSELYPLAIRLGIGQRPMAA